MYCISILNSWPIKHIILPTFEGTLIQLRTQPNRDKIKAKTQDVIFEAKYTWISQQLQKRYMNLQKIEEHWAILLLRWDKVWAMHYLRHPKFCPSIWKNFVYTWNRYNLIEIELKIFLLFLNRIRVRTNRCYVHTFLVSYLYVLTCMFEDEEKGSLPQALLSDWLLLCLLNYMYNLS